MISKITDKFQVTIPKEVSNKLKIATNDSIEWKFEKGRVIIEPVKKTFLKYRGAIKTGAGDIDDDIKNARDIIAKKIR